MPETRPTTGGRFALDITGANAGMVKKFDGLQMEADIVTSAPGPANVRKKRVTSIRWTPARATLGVGMSKELYAVVRQALKAEQKPFDGALLLADLNYKVQSSLNFTGAVLRSMTFPKLDGSSKDAAYFDLEWEAETVRWLKGDNSDIRSKVTPKQKAWLSSNFRFEMGGLPCNRVATIDSFTWQCSVVTERAGTPVKRPVNVTVPNIKVEVSMADHDAWAEAARRWFIDGLHNESDEMTGAIVFLNPDMKSELGRVSLKNCGFVKFARAALEANIEAVARFTAEFYVEDMEFVLKEFEAT
jgi:hypothetical protein